MSGLSNDTESEGKGPFKTSAAAAAAVAAAVVEGTEGDGEEESMHIATALSFGAIPSAAAADAEALPGTRKLARCCQMLGCSIAGAIDTAADAVRAGAVCIASSKSRFLRETPVSASLAGILE